MWELPHLEQDIQSRKPWCCHSIGFSNGYCNGYSSSSLTLRLQQ